VDLLDPQTGRRRSRVHEGSGQRRRCSDADDGGQKLAACTIAFPAGRARATMAAARPSTGLPWAAILVAALLGLLLAPRAIAAPVPGDAAARLSGTPPGRGPSGRSHRRPPD